MKKLLVVSALLVSQVSFADIDYSRCSTSSGLQITGVHINNDGKLEAGEFVKLKGVKTEGKVETHTFELSGYGGVPGEFVVQIERDEQGRVIKASTGGERPSKEMIDSWIKYMGQGQGYGFGYGGGFGHKEPVYNIDGRNVPMDKVTKEQAKEAGFGNKLDEMRKLKAAKRKDKKTLAKLKEIQSQIHAKANYVIPFGQESEFEIKDGVCMPLNISSKTYSTKTKEVNKELVSSKAGCEELQTLYKKYEPKLNECGEVSHKLNEEYYENFAKKKSNGHFNPYMGGGMVGGYVTGGYMAGGMVGGVSVGSTYSSYGPYANAGMMSGELTTCEWTYGVGRIGFGIMGGESQGGSQSGSGSSSTQQ